MMTSGFSIQLGSPLKAIERANPGAKPAAKSAKDPKEEEDQP